MRIAYVLIGLVVAAAVGYKVHSATPTVAPTVAMPVATETPLPSATASATPELAAPTQNEFVRVPDLAFRRLDVAEYLLSGAGLGHTIVGGGRLGVLSADEWEVCATIPRANTRIRTGTRVALVVKQYGCDGR